MTRSSLPPPPPLNRIFPPRILRLLLVLATACFQTGHAAPTPIPIKDLFRPAIMGALNLSPSGRYLAIVHRDDKDNHNLLVKDLTDESYSALRGTPTFGVYGTKWRDDDHLILKILQDNEYNFGLYVAPRANLRKNRPLNVREAFHLIGMPRDRPDRLLVWCIDSAFNDRREGCALEIGIDNNNSSIASLTGIAAPYRVIDPPATGDVTGWMADYDGEPAICYTSKDGVVTAYRYLPATKSWQKLPFDLDDITIHDVDPDGRHLWIAQHLESGESVLRRYDPRENTFEDPIFKDPDYDLGQADLWFSNNTRKLAGFYLPRHKLTCQWFDSDFATAQTAIDQKCPTLSNRLIDLSSDCHAFLFRCESPSVSPRYYLVDVAQKSLRALGNACPWLDGVPMADTQPVAFTARDGLKLEAYLTLPAEASRNHPVPLVVLCHGGPWARDTWSYDPEVQFLTSRGYAVVQPNYRGSEGYSPAVSLRPYWDFARMRDDVIDATHAVVRTGLIDPGRVAIMGGSFGGYLSLASLVAEPDLYRCGVTECGVFDWESLLRNRHRYGSRAGYERWADHLGRPGRDSAGFDEISPLRHLDRVKAPVFIAHGKDDQVVDIAQSKALAAGLKKLGLPHETFFRDLEGHGFYGTKSNLEYYTQLERFLAKNLAANP